jgi:hypothetical protein
MESLKPSQNPKRQVENLEPEGVEIGQTYPLVGMITNLTEGTNSGDIIVELNHKIRAKLFVSSKERIEILKRRAFEKGVFISRVTSVNPMIEVECQAVIFGKRQSFSA